MVESSRFVAICDADIIQVKLKIIDGKTEAFESGRERLVIFTQNSLLTVERSTSTNPFSLNFQRPKSIYLRERSEVKIAVDATCVLIYTDGLEAD